MRVGDTRYLRICDAAKSTYCGVQGELPLFAVVLQWFVCPGHPALLQRIGVVPLGGVLSGLVCAEAFTENG